MTEDMPFWAKRINKSKEKFDQNAVTPEVDLLYDDLEVQVERIISAVVQSMMKQYKMDYETAKKDSINLLTATMIDIQNRYCPASQKSLILAHLELNPLLEDYRKNVNIVLDAIKEHRKPKTFYQKLKMLFWNL